MKSAHDVDEKYCQEIKILQRKPETLVMKNSACQKEHTLKHLSIDLVMQKDESIREKRNLWNYHCQEKK